MFIRVRYDANYNEELCNMKRIICLLTVFLLTMTLACPAFAAEGFVPSISDKEEPGLVPNDQGILGLIYNADGEEIGKIDGNCLVITPISKIDVSTAIPEYARQIMKDVYKALSEGDMTLPYELDNLDPAKMVIRDLIDATFLCTEHPDMLVPDGVTLELTFDIGVSKGVPVYVYTYNDADWNKVVKVTNNGDGTVTVVFEHLCPIAFCVPSDANVPPVQTGDAFASQMNVWLVLMAVSAAALVAMFVLRRRAK
jgi:hypothetical protein